METEAHILVVDDEERIRRLVRMYLEKEGYTLDEAADGDQGLQMANETDYDVILLDVMMPGKDGIEDLSGNPQGKGNTNYHADS